MISVKPSELIRDFYVPRLNFYFDKAIKGEYADMVEYDTLFLNVAEPGELSEVQPFADPLKEACRLVDRYSDVVGGSDCSAGEGILYWCPQDFVRQGKNRIRITVPSSEFVRKKGMKFSKLRGDMVKIRKIVSGRKFPLWGQYSGLQAGQRRLWTGDRGGCFPGGETAQIPQLCQTGGTGLESGNR